MSRFPDEVNSSGVFAPLLRYRLGFRLIQFKKVRCCCTPSASDYVSRMVERQQAATLLAVENHFSSHEINLEDARKELNIQHEDLAGALFWSICAILYFGGFLSGLEIAKMGGITSGENGGSLAFSIIVFCSLVLQYVCNAQKLTALEDINAIASTTSQSSASLSNPPGFCFNHCRNRMVAKRVGTRSSG